MISTPRRCHTDGTDVFTAYAAYMKGLAIVARVKAVRRRRAAALLARYPELDAWMARPAPARIADLRRAKAWPFVIWCMVEGHLPGDLELLLAKPEGVPLSPVWDAAHPGERERAAEVARTLGWSENWIETMTRHTMPVVCVWAGKSLYELTEHDLNACSDALTASAYLSSYVKGKTQGRLHTIWQICYQLGNASKPARRYNATGRTAIERTGAAISQSGIRTDVVRYATTVATTLRPSSLSSRMKASQAIRLTRSEAQ